MQTCLDKLMIRAWHAMFERLAHEERLHYQALAKVYDHLNTFGTMKWVGHD